MKCAVLLLFLSSAITFSDTTHDIQLLLQEQKPVVQSWKALRDKGVGVQWDLVLF